MAFGMFSIESGRGSGWARNIYTSPPPRGRAPRHRQAQGLLGWWEVGDWRPDPMGV